MSVNATEVGSPLQMIRKRPRPTTSTLTRRWAELRRMDKRQRKYLSAKLILKIAPVLPGFIVKKMKRRIVKYSPFPVAVQPGLRRPQRSLRIRQIEADLKRAARRSAN